MIYFYQYMSTFFLLYPNGYNKNIYFTLVKDDFYNNKYDISLQVFIRNNQWTELEEWPLSHPFIIWKYMPTSSSIPDNDMRWMTDIPDESQENKSMLSWESLHIDSIWSFPIHSSFITCSITLIFCCDREESEECFIIIIHENTVFLTWSSAIISPEYYVMSLLNFLEKKS